jgi:hypothetical protein
MQENRMRVSSKPEVGVKALLTLALFFPIYWIIAFAFSALVALGWFFVLGPFLPSGQGYRDWPAVVIVALLVTISFAWAVRNSRAAYRDIRDQERRYQNRARSDLAFIESMRSSM